MLEKLMKLYVMAMELDVRSPLPHVIGPPGCGKSTVARQLADMVGVNLHIVNVSRMSPLEIEGVQMPHAGAEITDDMVLKMLHSTLWTSLKEGDIVLFDEFLRGFPEIYNGLLDIFTSRHVAGLDLPRVFIMAASNTAVSYDSALADRLLHLPVDDPRKHKRVRKVFAQLIVDQLGLLPSMVESTEMEDLIMTEVCPMFAMLDSLKGSGSGGGAPSAQGRSIRNLIGQAQLREIQSPPLRELLDHNNRQAWTTGKLQYLLLVDGKSAAGFQGYIPKANALVGNKKLTAIQATNLALNLQLIQLEEIRIEKGTDDDADIFN